MKLTIGIPTYNRPKSLIKRIEEIERFRDVVDRLIICDNGGAADPDVQQRVSDCPWISYHRTPANVGGGANFLRVVELAQGDYLWWRGDDDPITSAQVEALSTCLNETEQLILLSPDTPSFRGVGIREFAENFRNVQSVGWLSMIILPTRLAKRALRFGYWGIHTGWANVSLVLGLFRVEPALPFRVVPFKLDDGDFREDGGKAVDWAFFETCIRKFPATAQIIDDPLIRSLYLSRWRAAQPFSLMRTMVRLRLGLTKQERIGVATLLPLLQWTSPRTLMLFLGLMLLSVVPRTILRWLFAAYSCTLPALQLERWELGFLNNVSAVKGRYTLLKENQSRESVKAFL